MSFPSFINICETDLKSLYITPYQKTSVMYSAGIARNLRKVSMTFVLDVEPRTMQNRFKAIVKRCGIRDAHFHTLRHTFATRCIGVGFDVKSHSEILGHANVSITLNRYVHPSMELKQKNMDKLSELFAVK